MGDSDSVEIWLKDTGKKKISKGMKSIEAC